MALRVFSRFGGFIIPPPNNSGTPTSPGGGGGSGVTPPGVTTPNIVTTGTAGLMSPELLASFLETEASVETLTQGHNNQQQAFASMSDAVGAITETVGFHGEHLENLDALLANLGNVVTDHASRLTNVEGLAGSASSAASGAAALAANLSTTVSQHATAIGGLSDQVTDLDTRLSTVEGELSTTASVASGAATAAGTALSVANNAATDASSALSAANAATTAVSALQSSVTEYEDRIDALEAAGTGGGAVTITTVESALANYGFVKADTTKFYRVSTPVAANWMVTTVAAQGWADGDEIRAKNLGPELLTITTDAGVTVNVPTDGTMVVEPGSTIVLRKTATGDVWDLIGQTVPSNPFDPDSKVDVTPGYGLSENNFSTEEKNKLASLAQSDWNAVSGEPGHILNKPTSLGGMTIDDLRYNWMDFVGSASPWTGAAITSGTITNTIPAAIVTADPDFYGLAIIRCTATADTGYRITNGNTQMVLAPGHHFTARFMIPISGMTTAWAIIGYHDTTAKTDPVDGVYLKLSGNVATFVTANNSARTVSANISIANLKWYTLHIDVISMAEVRFSLYNDTDDVPVAAETITTNIPPTNATRALGAGVVAVGSHLAVADVLALDWIGCGPKRHSAFGPII